MRCVQTQPSPVVSYFIRLSNLRPCKDAHTTTTRNAHVGTQPCNSKTRSAACRPSITGGDESHTMENTVSQLLSPAYSPHKRSHSAAVPAFGHRAGIPQVSQHRVGLEKHQPLEALLRRCQTTDAYLLKRCDARRLAVVMTSLGKFLWRHRLRLLFGQEHKHRTAEHQPFDAMHIHSLILFAFAWHATGSRHVDEETIDRACLLAHSRTQTQGINATRFAWPTVFVTASCTARTWQCTEWPSKLARGSSYGSMFLRTHTVRTRYS
ncbi:uncharacterized protein B0H18DRAFT_1031256 [Fomitopsis serialis]|uniref:uncharacterized protein n=1 Tax=Fomitopsis serialis TaxID=139415 RepID=UPI00200804C1|nr:uncharacterized protein B0H18DRAFT_1031256 [Neoantrodia serialis]KAH9918443.1 hypothetical protein B0H18DRAFT_1031256 [Neoantrodia serialis]